MEGELSFCSRYLYLTTPLWRGGKDRAENEGIVEWGERKTWKERSPSVFFFLSLSSPSLTLSLFRDKGHTEEKRRVELRERETWEGGSPSVFFFLSLLSFPRTSVGALELDRDKDVRGVCER